VLDAEGFEATRDVLSRSFGPFADGQWARRRRVNAPTVEAGRQFGGYEGGRLVAVAAALDLTQWWHGRAVSTGGIGAVAVAPEARGRGAARELMAGVLERCAELGHSLSMLYPATTPLYRSLGWEHAGAAYHATLPADALHAVRPEKPVEVRRAGPDDAAEIAETIRRVNREQGNCGPIDWGERQWRLFLEPEPDQPDQPDQYVYLAEDGVLDYGWGDGGRTLAVERLLANSPVTLRTFWAMVGSHSSIATSVTVCVAPHDPVFWLLRDRAFTRLDRQRWMLRVVDAPAAIEARGFPPGVSAEVPLEIHDERRPGNAGSWRLVVKDGEGRLERATGTKSAVRVGARGLAALYSGVPTSTLRAAGLLEGGAPVLDAVFAATAFAVDEF
jgi:predicted acetyltransferase